MSKKPVLSAIALAAAAAVLLGVYFMARPETTAGEKELTIQVVHGNQSEKVFEVTTSAEFLADVLKEHNIAQGEDGAAAPEGDGCDIRVFLLDAQLRPLCPPVYLTD